MEILVFDVNETLLDLSSLNPRFERLFGDPAAAGDWFGQLLRNAMVCTLTGSYRDFGRLGRDALRLTARRRGISLTDLEVQSVVDAMTELPAHPDVRPALARLQDGGFRLAALSNSSADGLARQLSNAGLADFFEAVLSVDAVRVFKPHPAVYRMAAEKLEAPIGRLRMIAAHSWDTTGAIRAGMRAAFVARPGTFLGENDERPEIIGADLEEIADRLLAGKRP